MLQVWCIGIGIGSEKLPELGNISGNVSSRGIAKSVTGNAIMIVIISCPDERRGEPNIFGSSELVAENVMNRMQGCTLVGRDIFYMH